MHIELRPMLAIPNRNPYAKEPILIDLLWLTGLLEEISRKRDLAEVFERSTTYHHDAWEKLSLLESQWPIELINQTKGNGVQLSNFGDFMIDFVEEIQNHCKQKSRGYQKSMLGIIERIRLAENARWRFYSSSDAIMERAVHEIKGFELKIVDSSEAIHKILTGEADIIGYNTSNQKRSISIYQHLLAKDIQAFPMSRRLQGLLVKKGNPLDIHSIADLTRNKVRFINRQKGSGTRMLLDELLDEKGIKPSQINGYIKEELRHSSLANAILANLADVGLGLGDVAASNDLGFIPLREEVFFIAVRKELATEKKVVKLIESISRYSNQVKGYSPFDMEHDGLKWLGTPPRARAHLTLADTEPCPVNDASAKI